jgi:Zn-dependent M28 family amino/carboxypeptidase
MPGFSPNVICTYPSTHNSTEHVILSAHYDSRGSFGNTRAPGGDDDGSGSGHLLGVVEAIKRGGVQFEKKVQVAFFSGEEQGLFGSHAYAGELFVSRVDTSADIRIPAQDERDCDPAHSS